MTPDQWGKQFEAMAHKAEECSVELPPNWGKDSDKLIAKHLAEHSPFLLLIGYSVPDEPWQLFFAE